MLSGEVVGHAAPIGSGKTTLVLQVMLSRAQQAIAHLWKAAKRDTAKKTAAHLRILLRTRRVVCMPTL